jgi:hypothetical protein
LPLWWLVASLTWCHVTRLPLPISAVTLSPSSSSPWSLSPTLK